MFKRKNIFENTNKCKKIKTDKEETDEIANILCNMKKDLSNENMILKNRMISSNYFNNPLLYSEFLFQKIRLFDKSQIMYALYILSISSCNIKYSICIKNKIDCIFIGNKYSSIFHLFDFFCYIYNDYMLMLLDLDLSIIEFMNHFKNKIFQNNNSFYYIKLIK